MTLVKSISES